MIKRFPIQAGRTIYSKKDVTKLAKSLESHIDILKECYFAPNIKSKLEAPTRHKKKIDKLAFKVIEEAVKIKTKDIG